MSGTHLGQQIIQSKPSLNSKGVADLIRNNFSLLHRWVVFFEEGGLFGCDSFSVFSDEGLEVADTVKRQ